MSFGPETKRYVPTHEKLGTPDYEGTWQDEGGEEGSFSMHILVREKITEENSREYGILHQQSGMILKPEGEGIIEDAEGIEGVIVDNIGVAVFAGIKTSTSLHFVKSYSSASRKRGASSEIIYMGIRNAREGTINGNYHLPLIGKSGKFSVTENFPS